MTDTIPEGLRVFNYARSEAKLPSAAAIPTLNAEAFKALSTGDDDPYFKIEAIDFPAPGAMGVYERGFFESFVNLTKDRPIPGSKRGHEFATRPSSDFYTVGGKVEPAADGKSGTAFLKIYIPPKGDTTDNAGFIRDARAGIVHFSIVTKPEFTMKRDALGKEEMHFTASKGAERNDAVEYGGGAMAQVVNSDGAAAQEQGGGIPTITIGGKTPKSGVMLTDLGGLPLDGSAPPAGSDEIPTISIGAAGAPQDSGDGIPTITIGGNKK